MRYTFSDEEDDGSDATSNRRSMRQSGISTPAEPAGPTITASGRQVKSRVGGTYGETIHSGQRDEIAAAQTTDDIDGAEEGSRATRNERSARSHIRSFHANNVDDMEDESEASSSGNEWNGDNDGDDDVEDNIGDEDEDEEMSDVSAGDDDLNPRSLVISLKVSNNKVDSKVESETQQDTKDTHMTNGDSVAGHTTLVPSAPAVSMAPTPIPQASPQREMKLASSTKACSPANSSANTTEAVNDFHATPVEHKVDGHGPTRLPENVPQIS
jgi:hypothetical protein